MRLPTKLLCCLSALVLVCGVVATSVALDEVVIQPVHPSDGEKPCDDDKPCEDDKACEEDKLSEKAASAASEEGEKSEEPAREMVSATHKQTKVIEVNTEDLPKSSLRSFCLMQDGKILAAVGGKSNEVRLFDADGAFLSNWELPIDPEAINVGSDGYVYLAGDGKLFRMTSEGKIAHQAEAPHVADAKGKRDEIRETIVKQQKTRVDRYKKMAERYAERLKTLEEKAAERKKGEEETTEAQERQLTNAKRMKEQWDTIVERMDGQEVTDEEIDRRVAASIKSSAAVASISEAAGEVFLATREAGGYGYCVWRMSPDFDKAEVITKGLSGCCGQMDVQCCENGVYVAENSRKRVYRVSRTGEELGEWGHSAREGLEGFGSCCNPMNVCFGPKNSVYTAESGTGRIKRYTPEGKLIELVGKVDIVPGCKKVSIAANNNGDRVYMMDITRHHIVMMQRLADGEEATYREARNVETKQASVPASRRAFTVEVSAAE